MTAAWSGFRSPLAVHIERYLATKRALGCRFHSEDRTLRVFDRFLVEAGATTIEQITGDVIDRFLASRPRRVPKSYNHLLSVVRRLRDWLVSQQVIAASPVRVSARRETARRLPFLFTPPLARRLLDVARALPDNNRSRYRGPTYHTIFALLYGLGLRVGEVSRLQLGDVEFDRDVLLICDSKFGKSRQVPFRTQIGCPATSVSCGPTGQSRQ